MSRRPIMQGLSAAMAGAALLAFGVAQASDQEAEAPKFVVLEQDANIPFAANISGYTLAEDGSVLINVGPNRVYRAVTWRTCRRDLRYEHAIGIDHRGGSRVDRYSTLIIDGRRCPIESLDRIEPPKRGEQAETPAEAPAEDAG